MKGNKIVVYTAIFNDYDALLQPKVNPENVDFICFTDNPDTAQGVWEPRVISDYDISPKLMSGKMKLLTHQLFPEYDYSIWVDGNIHVIGDVRDIIEANLQQVNMATIPHPNRSCIYEEAAACTDLDLGDPGDISTQMKRYRDIGFPEDYGLSETRIMIRRHHEPDVVEAMETWWKEYQKGAERDQLSFEFAAWKCGFQYDSLDIDVQNRSGHFYLHNHKPPGFRGEIWEFLLRGREESSGQQSLLFGLLLTTGKLIKSIIY